MEVIEQNEIETLLRGLGSARRFIWAMAAALQRMEQQTAAAQELLRVVEFRKTYMEE